LNYLIIYEILNYYKQELIIEYINEMRNNNIINKKKKKKKKIKILKKKKKKKKKRFLKDNI